MATIALTGATGFLGSKVLARLVGEHSVVVLKRSRSKPWRIQDFLDRVRTYNLDEVPVARVFEENQIEIVVHCATNYGRGASPPADIVRANLILPLELIQCAHESGARAFVNSDTILDKRVNYYSLSKHQFGEWLALFSERMVSANMALEHFFGPLDDRSKFVTSVILDLLRGVDRIALTPGLQRRDFIFVDDVVEAFAKVVTYCQTAPNGMYRFEVGTGMAMPLRDFVTLAKDLSHNQNTHLDFGALPYRQNEVMESKVDISQLRTLGWQSRVSVRDGLLRTIQGERGDPSR